MVSGTNPRELKGKLIASMKNAVKRINEQTYMVSSQNGNGKYYDVWLNSENEWQCECADFSYRHQQDPSLAKITSSHVLDCHICNSQNTELIPISTDESFRIEYSQTKGNHQYLLLPILSM
jgi:hypothetical protein